NRDITARKQAEEKLRQSEEQLASAVAGSGVGLWDWYPQTGAETFNERWAEILGYTLAELAPTSIETWRSLSHPDDLRRADELLEEHFSGRSPIYSCETRMRHKDGHWVWVLDRGKVSEWDSDGRPLRMIGTQLDISARKRAEDSLRESEEKHRLLIENSHDIIYTLSADGVFTFVSPAWTALLGHAVDQVVGQQLQHFVHPDDLAGCMVFLQAVIETGQRQEGVEYRVRRLDGSWRWYTSSAVPLRDEAGAVVGFEGTARDVTERRQADEALREQEELLARMARFTEELLEAGAGEAAYQRILDNLIYLSKAKYGALTLLDRNTGKFTTVAVAGMKDSLQKVSRLLGFQLIGKEWNDYSIENERLKGQRVSHFASMSDLSARVVPEIVSKAISKLVNMGEVTVTKVIVNQQMIGDFTLIMPAGKRFENEYLVEIYSRQIDMFITRIQAEEEIKQRNQELAHLNDELVGEAAALAEANAAITRLAATDDLTGLANRRCFYDSLEKAVSLARRHGSPLALVSLDLDGLKRVNDSAGHEAGDEALTSFAALLAALCRIEDLPGRLGGDEFSVLLPGIDRSGALGLAERVLAAVRSSPVLAQRGVTVSAGAAFWTSGALPDDLLRRADEALYAAKRGGGDAVAGNADAVAGDADAVAGDA
ncbi:MAG: PAS domain-containing protein, partial [Actinomycetes bacterium]